jgi:prolyl-tRNA editing enzyme YbaK/EbsC (Cys-tRNA(Pro) deacylase)
MRMQNSCTAELENAGARFEIIKLAESVHSVSDVEKACGCQTAEVIKTLLFIGRKPVMVILSGDKRADTEKIKGLFKEDLLRMATKEEVLALTGYAVGSVSPFGINPDIRQIADESIWSLPSLIMGSGKNDVLIRLKTPEFAKAFRGSFAPISL